MAAQMEAWSTGPIHVGVEKLEGVPIVAAVEILRVSLLVFVIARADSDDPSFRGVFPIVMTSVEVYPIRSFAPDPLADMGRRIAEQFLAKVVQSMNDARAELAGDGPKSAPS